MKWETPKLIKLVDRLSTGQCKTGTSDVDACQSGGNVLIACTTGGNAHASCGSGPNF